MTEFQISQLKEEEKLFYDIAEIKKVDYMRLSDGTH